MRFGVQIGVGIGEIGRVRDQAQQVEGLGFDLLYFPDHLLLEGPERQRVDGPSFDSMAMAAIAAQATSRIHIGHLVLCNLFRHPAVTAQSLATLDHLSGGRMVVGLGSGWTETEFRMTGIPFPPISERLRMLDESLTCIRGLWGDAPFSFDGEFYHFRDADLLPKTVQKPHPRIVLGGGGKGLLRIAARHADVLNVISDVGRRGFISMQGAAELNDQAFTGKLEFVRAEAARLGRAPQAVEMSNFAFNCMVADSAEQAPTIREGMAAMLGSTPEEVMRSPISLVGTPDELIAELQRRAREWELRELVMQWQDEASVSRFAREVIPALRD